jgi:hypothetical protein
MAFACRVDSRHLSAFAGGETVDYGCQQLIHLLALVPPFITGSKIVP